MTRHAPSIYLITRELQSTHQVSGIERAALRTDIPCMVHVIQPAVGASMGSRGINGCTKSWEAHEHHPQFGENQIIDIGDSQRLRKEGNARINKVAAMRPALAKIIEKVYISRYFESPDTDRHIAVNACYIAYTNTWSSKWVHWLWKSQSADHSTTCYRFEDTVEFDIGVTWASLLNTAIHLWVAQDSEI